MGDIIHIVPGSLTRDSNGVTFAEPLSGFFQRLSPDLVVFHSHKTQQTQHVNSMQVATAIVPASAPPKDDAP